MSIALILGLPFSEILALLSLVSLVVGGAVTALGFYFSSKFVNKRAYYAKRDQDKEELEACFEGQDEYHKQAKAEREEIKANLVRLEQSHTAAIAGPLESLSRAMGDIRDDIRRSNDRAQIKDERYLEALSQLTTRVGILEATRREA